MIEIEQVTKGNSRYYVVHGDPAMEGMKLPSVTTVLGVINKPALVGWAAKVTAEKAASLLSDKEAHWERDLAGFAKAAAKAPGESKDGRAGHGKAIHERIEKLVKGELLFGNIEPVYAPGVRAFIDWSEAAGIDWVAGEAEMMVYSRSMGVGGQIDLIGTKPDGTRIIADVKTGKAIYDEAWLQVCAYWRCYNEMKGGADKALLALAHMTPSASLIEEGWVLRVPNEENLGNAGFEAKQIDSDAVAIGMEVFDSAVTLFEGLKTKRIWMKEF
jgi:hypothetical protein